jgi:hypothetical protein
MEEVERTVRSSRSGKPGADRDPLGEFGVAGHVGDCPYGCPVCAAIGILKQMSPDVTRHLAAATREFVLAARAFLDGVAERNGREGTKVEHIAVD